MFKYRAYLLLIPSGVILCSSESGKHQSLFAIAFTVVLVSFFGLLLLEFLLAFFTTHNFIIQIIKSVSLF